MILSIIIPMYNVELYIIKCLESCINQNISISDYEIIVINDGSIDNSLSISEKIASRYNNIKIYSQRNGGLSLARNYGLQYAKGDYIWFVDSDDWIVDNCLKDIVSCLVCSKPDILQLQYRKYYDDVNLNNEFYCTIDGIKDGKEVIKQGGLPIPAPFAIYKKSFLYEHQLCFYPRILHEDCEFKPKAVYLAKRCASFDSVVYNYYQRSSGSITSTINPKHAFDYLTVAKSIHDFYISRVNSNCDSYFNNYISMIINNALSSVADKGNEFSQELKRHKYLFDHLLKSTKIKYKIEGVLFYIFPKYTVSIYKLLKKVF